MSTNLSKLKREKLIKALEIMKDKYMEDLPMLNTIIEIENTLTKTKYGLVFEEHEERVDIEFKTKIPVFAEDKAKEIKLDTKKPINFLLEGDNLHSLKLLEKTHKGAIDIIYIDPPYNTGNEDFIYDDNYVDNEDGFKHSKWLSFMEKRLNIARNLLSSKGFIFISIDDKEASQLKLLCDEIFSESNYETTKYIQVRYSEKTLKQDMKYHKQIEQVLVYRKSESATPYLKPEDYTYDKFNYSIEELSKGAEMELGEKKVIKFERDEYKIIKKETGTKEGLKEIWATGTILNGNSSGRFFRDYLNGRKDIDGLGILYKVYGIGDDKYDFRYFTGPQRATATKGKYYQGVPVEKLEENSNKVSPIPNFYDMAGDFGNIRHEGGVPFNSGKKPVKLIRKFLEYFERKDITVLDFFAGSGTTGHAVLELNKEDGGTRSFILCANNQNRICEDITYKRLSNVIKGYSTSKGNVIEGFGGNLKYYKTDYIDKFSDDEYSDIREELKPYIEPLIQLENCIDINSNKIIVILTDEDAATLITSENLLNAEKIYIGSDVLMSGEQEYLISRSEVIRIEIPEYYFSQELWESEIDD